MSLAQGTRLGPYEILSPLGAGGMGEVYRARDSKLGRDVAIKVLPEEFFEEEERIARFEREAKSLAAVSHPHIAALYSFEEISGRHLLVMELVEGETLADRLLKGPLPPDQVLKTGIEIASALDAAHRAGIVHRDLKPGNVMLTRSGVKLLDFGLAKALAPEGPVESLTSAPTTARDVTRQGEILGTLSYMAPEQLEGKKPDSRTDIFALGATLYEMATGRKTFTGTSQASLITAIMTSEPQPISVVQPMTPPALDRVVKTCLAKDPDDRWQSARDVNLQLQSIADGGSQVGSRRPSSPRARARAPRLVPRGHLSGCRGGHRRRSLPAGPDRGASDSLHPLASGADDFRHRTGSSSGRRVTRRALRCFRGHDLGPEDSPLASSARFACCSEAGRNGGGGPSILVSG